MTETTRPGKSRANSQSVEASSGNVFADLGFRNADERLLKAKLATKIAQLIEQKGWIPAQLAERLALDQLKLSRLASGQLSTFSVDCLIAIRMKLK
jgi:predicted XRE-type DNA-binding protein